MKLSISKNSQTKEISFFPCYLKKERWLPEFKAAKMIEGAVVMLWASRYFKGLRVK